MIEGHGSEIRVTGSEIRQNSENGVSGIDGAVSVAGSLVRDNGGAGIRNTGNSPTGQPLTVTDTLVDHNRGGVQCSFCTNLTITGSTIVDNLPRPDGFSGSGVFFMANVVGPSATITGSTIEANPSGEPGGGVRLIADDVMPVATIGSTTIQGNRTVDVFDDGGGIYAESIDLRIQDGSHVDGNFAKPEGIVVGGDGGGIAQLGGELQVTASTVDGNFADRGGGGIDLVDVAEATLTDASVSSNTAGFFGGGGVSSAGEAALLGLATTSVADDTAQLAGGGVAVAAAGVEVQVERSTIAGTRRSARTAAASRPTVPASRCSSGTRRSAATRPAVGRAAAC